MTDHEMIRFLFQGQFVTNIAIGIIIGILFRVHLSPPK